MNSSDAIAGTNAQSAQYNSLRQDLRLALKSLITDTDATTITFDMGTNGSCLHKVILGGNRTLAVSNLVAGQSFVLIIGQDATPPRTVTWFLSPGAGTHAIKWVGATVPTLTTVANNYDIFSFFYDGVDIFGSIVGLNFG